MAIAQQPTQIQPSGLAQVYIKGPGDDGSDNGLDDGLGGSLDDGLSDLIRRHTARKPDDRKEVKIEHTYNTKKMLKEFNKVLKLDDHIYFLLEFKKHLERTLTDVLTPTEINILLQTMLHDTENEPVNYLGNQISDDRMGLFITQLIQLSYDAGNNDFMLVTENPSRIIGDIGFRLNGNKKKLVKIKIHGDVNALCHCSSYCEIDLDGDIQYDILGTGNDSHHCIFTFRGEVPSNNNYSAEESIYKTSNKRAIETLIRRVLHGGYNQIVFINQDGTEEAVLRHTHDPSTGILINAKYYSLVEKIYREEDPEYKYSAMDKLRNIKKLQVIPIR